MAEINIQRKKSAPSPWLLVLLAALVLGGAAYFFLRPDPPDEPTPAVPTEQGAVPDTAAAPSSPSAASQEGPASAVPLYDSAALRAPAADEADAATPAALAAQAATSPAAPDYALHGLQKLTGVLVALADRDDLRDPLTSEQRDNLTSATARLGEPNASLRPGFVAAAGLIRTMQQKAYPELESQADDLVRLAGQLSGRAQSVAEQQQNQRFLTQAAAVVKVLSEPK